MEQSKDTSYPGYEVSDHGRVFSKRREVKANAQGATRIVEAKEKKLSDNGRGYKFVWLYYKGRAKSAYVHRLVAEAFIPNPEGKPTVNHKDGDKSNNRKENLEWATYKEQEAHSDRLGLSNRGTTRKEIHQYDAEGGFVASYRSSLEAAEKTGVCRASISECVRPFRGGGRTAGGYVWIYPEDPERDKQRVLEILNNRPGKKVHQYTKEGEFVASYRSVSEASKTTGISRPCIMECVSKKKERKRTTAGGYVWKYPEKEKDNRKDTKGAQEGLFN